METNYDALIQASADELFQQMSSKEDQKDIDRLRAAFEFAREAHSPQKRKSGEPYIIHPLQVAEILNRLDFDVNMLCAGLLHDTVEDCEYTIEELAKEKIVTESNEKEGFIGHSKAIGCFRNCRIMLYCSSEGDGASSAGVMLLKTAPAHYRRNTQFDLT